MELPVCNTLWIGDRLGPITAACLASFVRHGHRVRLYAYRPPADVPAGVELADAATVLPEQAIVRHRRSGSPALFSNRFRYTLLARDAGLWIDGDLYCVRPIDFPDAAVFGFEIPGSINTAVLRLAPDDPILARLEAIFTARTAVPPWVEIPLHRRTLLRAKQILGLRSDLGDLPWGVTGPRAVTWLLREAGRFDEAHPVDVFYPLHWDEIGRLFVADGDVEALVTPRTRTIHLWNNLLARRPLTDAETGSFLDRLVAGTLPF